MKFHEIFMKNVGINQFHEKKLLLLFFQTNCQPHITEAAKSSVEGICKKIYNLSCDYAQKIQEKNSEILKEHGISGMKISS